MKEAAKTITPSDIDILEDVAQPLTQDHLKDVNTLVVRRDAILVALAQLELHTKRRKAELQKIEMEDLPNLMESAGLTEFKTSSGRVVVLKDIVSASIPKAKQAEAFQWLRDNGHEHLIKVQLSHQFDKGQDKLSAEVIKYLAKKGIEVVPKESVHSQTLSAWCRERLAEGETLPADLLGLFTGKQAVIR